MALDEVRRLLSHLYEPGEAIVGSPSSGVLVDRLVRLVSEAVGSAARVVRFPAVSWVDGGAVVECGRLRFEGITLPQTLGGVAEGRLVEVHCTDPTCFSHVAPGDIVAARLPEDPDDVTTLYVAALEAGASALIVYDRWPGRLRRIVVSGRWDYALVPSPAPMPAVYLRAEDGARLVRACTGLRVRLEAYATMRPCSGRIIEVVVGEGDIEAVLMAHFDHWLGGAGDNLAGVVALLRAAGRVGRPPRGKRLRILLLDAEEFGDPRLPAWYWAYGSRWYARQLQRARLLEDIVITVNLEMPVVRELVVAATPEAAPRVAGMLSGYARVKRVEEFETCYSDGYSFATLGVPSATIYNIEDYIEWYHTDVDTPERPDPAAVEAAAVAAADVIRLFYEKGEAMLDYIGYAEMLSRLTEEAPLELKRAVYALREETMKAVEAGRWERLRRAYALLNARLGRCVFNGDYRWETGGFEPRLAPMLRAAIEALREVRGRRLAPGDRVVPGLEEKLPTPTPTPVKTWLTLGGQPPTGYWEHLERAFAYTLRFAAIEVADAVLEAYRVLRGG